MTRGERRKILVSYSELGVALASGKRAGGANLRRPRSLVTVSSSGRIVTVRENLYAVLRGGWKLFERCWEVVHVAALVLILLMVVVALLHGAFGGAP